MFHQFSTPIVISNASNILLIPMVLRPHTKQQQLSNHNSNISRGRLYPIVNGVYVGSIQKKLSIVGTQVRRNKDAPPPRHKL